VTKADQESIRVVLARGGTSKGLYLHDRDLPPPGARRDWVLARLMGSPDVLQIDGLGGSRPITSKVAIIKVSDRPDADVDYTFAQVDVPKRSVAYDVNCGNISSGVGPFAIDEGLVDAHEGVTRVRIYNTNTEKMLVADVPVRGGKAQVTGDFAVPGVPGTGAEIVMNWAGTIGSRYNALLPSGHVSDKVRLEDGRQVNVTLCDAANPCLWISGPDVGFRGDETVAEINGNRSLIAMLREIEAKAAQAFGFVEDWKAALSAGELFPLSGFVSPPASYTSLNGVAIRADDMDVRIHLIFMGLLHESIAGTGSISLAAASRVAGSVVHGLSLNTDGARLRIGHPSGVTPARVKARPSNVFPFVEFEDLGFSRTSRRLMDGNAYLPSADMAALTEDISVSAKATPAPAVFEELAD